MDRDGVRNEIEIATQLSTQLKDREFIIPLRVAKFDPHFRIAHLQYIDFSRSWASGLSELVELLTSSPTIPRYEGRSTELWLAAQSAGATRLVKKHERLTSNWLRFQSLQGHPLLRAAIRLSA